MADPRPTLSPPARLKLPGHEPTAARAEVVYRPRSVRLTRSLLSLAGFWALVPLVFFVPPHLPWALAAFALGVYFAWASWTGSYEVRALEGPCPRCGAVLTVKPGARIGLPHRLTCYHCHHHPQLDMSAAPE